MSSDQRRIIEQAKFTYFPLGKTFEKRIKTVKDQEGKQIETLEEHGTQLNLVETLRLLKQKEIFEELANKGIQNLSKQIDFNDLIYCYQGKSGPKTSIGFKLALGFYKKIKDGYDSI